MLLSGKWEQLPIDQTEFLQTDPQAISLLQNLLLAETLSATTSLASVSTKEPLIRAPSAHLALAATLVVHPSVTTRAPSDEQLAASDAALRLLHATLEVLGPVNARFGLAFTFAATGHAARGSTRRRRYDHHGNGESGSMPQSPAGSDDLDFQQQQQGAGSGGGRSGSMPNIPLATTSSIFSRADDFWHLVGWAFNCSIRHPKRWQRWKLLLGFFLDAIEDDLAVRTAAASQTDDQSAKIQANVAEQAEKNQTGQTLAPQFTDTLLLRYCNNAEGRAGRRRIMRAILADGSERSMREFREIFINEAAEKKKEEEKDKEGEGEKGKASRRELNFEEGLYGDYDSSDDELNIESRPTRTSKNAASQVIETMETNTEMQDDAKSEEQLDDGSVKTAADEFGGMDSVLLRQRLLLLVRCLSLHLTNIILIWLQLSSPISLPPSPPSSPPYQTFSPSTPSSSDHYPSAISPSSSNPAFCFHQPSATASSRCFSAPSYPLRYRATRFPNQRPPRWKSTSSLLQQRRQAWQTMQKFL